MSLDETLTDVEEAVARTVGSLAVDVDAMHAVANIFRTEAAVRNHMLREVLVRERLSWTSFVALWVLWVWGDQETRHLAAGCSVKKATITGVVKTLEQRDFVTRKQSATDGRVVLVSLTPDGRATISRLFPEFNRHEALVTGGLTSDERKTLARLLRKVLTTTTEQSPD
jgi:DNA-binding MarR family transcriptional regulator